MQVNLKPSVWAEENNQEIVELKEFNEQLISKWKIVFRNFIGVLDFVWSSIFATEMVRRRGPGLRSERRHEFDVPGRAFGNFKDF